LYKQKISEDTPECFTLCFIAEKSVKTLYGTMKILAQGVGEVVILLKNTKMHAVLSVRK